MNKHIEYPHDHDYSQDEINLGIWVYCLQAAGLLFTPLMLVAFILNIVKQGEVIGTVLQSHFKWQIRTFGWGLGWIIVSFIVPHIGWIMVMWVAIWLMYRIGRGFFNLSRRRPMYN